MQRAQQTQNTRRWTILGAAFAPMVPEFNGLVPAHRHLHSPQPSSVPNSLPPGGRARSAPQSAALEGWLSNLGESPGGGGKVPAPLRLRRCPWLCARSDKFKLPRVWLLFSPLPLSSPPARELPLPALRTRRHWGGEKRQVLPPGDHEAGCGEQKASLSGPQSLRTIPGR